MPELPPPQRPEPAVDLGSARGSWRIVGPRRAALVLPELTDLDPQQQAVALLEPGAGPRLVLGAPGTGRTTALLALAARRLREGLSAESLLVLTPSRASAARARDALTATAATTMSTPPVRAWQAYAFDLLRRAQNQGLLPGVAVAPKLLSGPEQDVLLRELMQGHERGHGAQVVWPGELSEAVGTRGFRQEIRDLFDRVSEHGLTPQDLDDLGRRMSRPDWVAAAALRREYLQVRRLRMPEAFDPSALVSEACRVLEQNPGFLAEEQHRLALVLADDLQEATPSMHRLLAVLCAGRDAVLSASPDTVVQGFRGARPDLLRGLGDRLGTGARPLVRHLLQTGHRMPEAVQLSWQRTADRLPGLAGSRQARRPRPASAGALPAAAPADGEPAVRATLLGSPAQEARWIGQAVLERHLMRGVALQDMAVIVRSSARLQSVQRQLTAMGVPVTTSAIETPVRDEPAVRPLLSALRLAVLAQEQDLEQEAAREAAPGDPAHAADGSRAVLAQELMSAQEAVELLGSRLGGASAMDLRRLRQRLRAAELRRGGGRSSDRLLVEALLDPGALEEAGVRGAARRVARMVQAARTALRDESATAETVLWALWDAAGVAGPWQRAALGGGPEGQRADRDLDAVVALFGTAERFVDHLPGAGPQEFLDFLEHQDLPMDTLAARAPAHAAVEIMTPATAAGRGWPVVFVAGVQEGQWPNTALRGQLLGAQLLTEVVELGAEVAVQAGPAARLAEVRHDELRSFSTAISRCSSELLVTAVSEQDEEPSEFVDLVDPWDPAFHPEAAQTARPVLSAPRPPTLRALTAELRAAVREPVASAQREAAARLLHRLAASPVPVAGAAPPSWWGLLPLSSAEPVVDPQQPVPLSPSRIEAIQRSPLDWFVSTARAEQATDVSRSVGTLVHSIAEEHPDGTGDQLAAEVVRRWPEMGLAPTWESELLLERAQQMVRKFATYVIEARKDAHRSLVLVEGAFEVLIRGRATDGLLRGRVDRLEIDQHGRYVVVDLKTGTHMPTRAEVPDHPQLLAYQSALAAGAGAAMVQAERERLAAKSTVESTAEGAEADSADDGEGDGQRAPLVLGDGPLPVLPGGAVLVQLGKDTSKSHATQHQEGLAADDDRVRELVTRAAAEVAGEHFLARHTATSGGSGGFGLGCRLPEICPICAQGRQVTE